MAYTPDAYDPAFPVGTTDVATLTAELRAIKAALLSQQNKDGTQDTAIQDNLDAIDALALALATGKRYQLLTDTTQATFTVPAGVTEMLVMAVGGGQGGQGGNGKARVRVRLKAYVSSLDLTTGWSSWHQFKQNGTAGKNGATVMELLSVTPEQTIDYICGAGGAGGALSVANASVTIEAPESTLDSDYYPAQWVPLVMRESVINIRQREITTDDAQPVTTPTSLRYNANFTGSCKYRESGQERFLSRCGEVNGTLALGAVGGDGGDTRFGIPANPNDPALLEVSGGKDAERTQLMEIPDGAVRQVMASLLGNYGLGGEGGKSSSGSLDNAANGLNGTQGAILLMW